MLTLWRSFQFCLFALDEGTEIDTLEEELEILSTSSTLEYMRELLIEDTIIEFSDDFCFTYDLQEILELVVLSIEFVEL